MKNRVSRRRFLTQSAAAAVGVSLWAAPAWVRAAGANEKLNIGVIGVANRGGANLAPDHATGRRTWEDFLAANV